MKTRVDIKSLFGKTIPTGTARILRKKMVSVSRSYYKQVNGVSMLSHERAYELAYRDIISRKPELRDSLRAISPDSLREITPKELGVHIPQTHVVRPMNTGSLRPELTSYHRNVAEYNSDNLRPIKADQETFYCTSLTWAELVQFKKEKAGYTDMKIVPNTRKDIERFPYVVIGTKPGGTRHRDTIPGYGEFRR